MMTATKIGKDNKESDWSDLRNRAIFYFDDYLLENKKDTINLAKLTQFITLALSLFYLFSDAGKAKRTLSSILCQNGPFLDGAAAIVLASGKS